MPNKSSEKGCTTHKSTSQMNLFDEVYMAGSQRASSEILIDDYSDCFVTENNLVSQCILLVKSSLESIHKDFLLEGTRVTNMAPPFGLHI